LLCAALQQGKKREWQKLSFTGIASISRGGRKEGRKLPPPRGIGGVYSFPISKMSLDSCKDELREGEKKEEISSCCGTVGLGGSEGSKDVERREGRSFPVRRDTIGRRVLFCLLFRIHSEQDGPVRLAKAAP